MRKSDANMKLNRFSLNLERYYWEATKFPPFKNNCKVQDQYDIIT